MAIRWAGGCSQHRDGASLALAFPPLLLSVLGYQLASCQPLAPSACGRAQLLDEIVEIPEMSEINSASLVCAGDAETHFTLGLSYWK